MTKQTEGKWHASRRSSSSWPNIRVYQNTTSLPVEELSNQRFAEEQFAGHAHKFRRNSRSQEIQQHPTPYEKVLISLKSDDQWLKEIEYGRRIGFYRIRNSLGCGNFSRVNNAVHCLLRDKVAVKIIEKSKLDSKTQNMLAREISNMDKMDHPNIIRLYEVIESPDRYHLVMECASGGELFAKISSGGRMPEPEAKPIFAQIASAIEYLHSCSVIHRDLKAENVFYSGPNRVKIGDFGFSRYVSSLDDVLNTFCGSPPYAAPELFQDDSYMGPYVDLWALGILLYFMVTAQMPFRAPNVSQLKKMIINGEYTIPAYVSQNCQDLVEALLQHKPKERIQLASMKYCRWLRDQEWIEPDTIMKKYVWPDEELETRRRLLDYGITEEMIEVSSQMKCRDPVCGMYRILLHRVQDGDSNCYIDEMNNNCERKPRFFKNKVSNKGAVQHKPTDRTISKSRTCNIL